MFVPRYQFRSCLNCVCVTPNVLNQNCEIQHFYVLPSISETMSSEFVGLAGRPTTSTARARARVCVCVCVCVHFQVLRASLCKCTCACACETLLWRPARLERSNGR